METIVENFSIYKPIGTILRITTWLIQNKSAQNSQNHWQKFVKLTAGRKNTLAAQLECLASLQVATRCQISVTYSDDRVGNFNLLKLGYFKGQSFESVFASRIFDDQIILAIAKSLP